MLTFTPTHPPALMLGWTIVCVLATGFAPSASAIGQDAVAETAGSSDSPFGAYAFELRGLRAPGAVAIGADDRIYVADTGNHRIRVFDATGRSVGTWGVRGAGPSEFVRPGGIAIGPDGDVYVSDSGNHRIQVFTSEGTFQREWGGAGSGPGRLIDPRGLTVAGESVFVADSGNDRVQVFDRKGRDPRTMGGHGTGRSRFRRLADVAVDSDGRLYVADTDNQRIAAFDTSGRFVKAWGRYGPFAGMLSGPVSLEYHDGRLYVAEVKNHRIQVFDPGGAALYQWGLHAFQPREGAGKLHYPDGIAIAPSGRFAVVCEAFEDRCQVFKPMPPGESPPENPFLGMDMTGSSHFGPWAASDANLLVCSELETDKVALYDTSRREPILIGLVGRHGRRPGRFIRPSGLALNAASSLLYVADAGNRRIQMFRFRQNPPGEYRFIPGIARFVRLIDLVALWRLNESLQAYPIIEPGALRCDAAGNVFVLDTRLGRVFVFDKQLNYVRTFGGRDAEAGRLLRPSDLAFDRAGGGPYVVDGDLGRVQVFNGAGEYRRGWDVGGADGGPVEPFGIAIGDEGSVFVTDMAGHRVMKYDADGRFIRAWGKEGIGAGEFFKPRGVLWDARGRITVIDHGNHRGQVFRPDGTYVDVFGSRFFIRPARRGRAAE